MQTHDLVNYAEKLSRAILKDTEKKAPQALNAQIQVTYVMSLQLQQLVVVKNAFQSPQGKPPFKGLCKKLLQKAWTVEKRLLKPEKTIIRPTNITNTSL